MCSLAWPQGANVSAVPLGAQKDRAFLRTQRAFGLSTTQEVASMESQRCGELCTILCWVVSEGTDVNAKLPSHSCHLSPLRTQSDTSARRRQRCCHINFLKW